MKNMKFSAKKKLFQDAFIEQVIEEVEDYVKISGESVGIINSSLIGANRSSAIDFYQLNSVVKRKKRIISFAMAALIILLSSLFIFAVRHEIVHFAQYVYERFVSFDHKIDSGNNITKIEEVYLPTYIPDEYELVSEQNDTITVYREWRGINDQNIVYAQRVSNNINKMVDNEYLDYSRVEIKNYSVYYFINGSSSQYVWYHDGYVFSLYAESVEDSVMLEIIENIMLVSGDEKS